MSSTNVACCIDLAGESPVRVIAGEPGSRPQATRETSSARARCRKPPGSFRRERGSGPQHEVNVAASSNHQPKGAWEGRADHATAKATGIAPGPERAVNLPGVGTAARFHRSVRNWRCPRWQPSSGKRPRISATRENVAGQQGVRGAHSTDEGGHKLLEGRSPASVASVAQVSARAWP